MNSVKQKKFNRRSNQPPMDEVALKHCAVIKSVAKSRAKRHMFKKCNLCLQSIKKRIRHFLPQLNKIRLAKRSARTDLIRNAEPCLLKFLSDICFGILKKVVIFPKRGYKRLSKFQNTIFQLGDNKNLTDDEKRELLLQKDGGFLPLIIPAIASAAFGLLGNLISKKLIG